MDKDKIIGMIATAVRTDNWGGVSTGHPWIKDSADAYLSESINRVGDVHIDDDCTGFTVICLNPPTLRKLDKAFVLTSREGNVSRYTFK
jgi:hypothetical protein